MEFSARSVILRASLGVSSATVFAQNYPTKPIRFARVRVQDLAPGLPSIPPEVPEAIRRKIRAAHSVLDVLVAEVALQRRSVMSLVGELLTKVKTLTRRCVRRALCSGIRRQ